MANDLMSMLQGQLSEGMLDQLTQQLGGTDKGQTAVAASGIMSTLMGALAKNASKPEGANALANALDKDHDGSVLEDMMGLLAGNIQPQNQRASNGAGIIKHILGDKQSNAISMISQMSGLDSGKTGNLMTMLAPIVMGTLGKTKRQQGLDVGGLASLLSGTVQNNTKNDPAMGLVGKLLDSDGDGSIVDDVASIGMKLLGGFLKRK